MSLDFGKLPFSVSFDPTSAFPLDARSYFESLDAAKAAAAEAVAAGDSNSAYYYGQTVVVIEDNSATSYIIQPDGELAPICKFNPSQFDSKNYSDKGIELKGYDEAKRGQFLRIDVEKTGLEWVDSYTKEEIDTTLSRIESQISTLTSLKRVIVTEEELQSHKDDVDAEQTIYMVAKTDSSGNTYYEEYILIVFGEDLKVFEKIGSLEVNLDNYVTKTDYNRDLENLNSRFDSVVYQDELKDYVTKDEILFDEIDKENFQITKEDIVSDDTTLTRTTLTLAEGKSLLTENEKNSIAKISTLDAALERLSFVSDIKEKLQQSLDIRTISNEFALSADTKELSLVKISMGKVEGLENTLEDIRTNLTTLNSLGSRVNSLEENNANLNSRMSDIENALLWKEIKEE